MLTTEMRNPKSMHIDKMDTLAQVKLMSDENFNAAKAVEAQAENVAKAIDQITAAFQKGGRLFYMGAGTSGRLGVLDASECPPTFGVPADKVIGIIAGGDNALRNASEGAEDNPNAGIEDLKKYNLTQNDVVVGISAAGGAAYVVNAILYAKEIGCVTVGLTCNGGSTLSNVSDIAIVTETGPEVITGSTRLKAGTAHKLVLNMLTTLSMVQCGYVYENLMVNLKPTNIKLRNRMIGIVMEITGCNEAQAVEQLDKNDWKIPNIVLANRG